MSNERPRATTWMLFFTALACSRRSDPTTSLSPATSATAGPPPISTPLHPHRGVPCGGLACAQFDSAADAFLEAISEHPRVLAIGEAHAPSGARVPSAARRFTEALLPLLSGRASDLLVELMMPPPGCVDASSEVRAKQEVVTSRQAGKNQSEYLEMGDRARSLGIVPDMLRPTCDDLALLRGDQGDAVGAALEAIARLTVLQGERLVARDDSSDADSGKMVVVYGGMLHDDLAPPPEKATWSYAPALDAYTHGHLIAVDLVVPEFIGDDETWRSLPWWSRYDKARFGAKATLLRTAQRSFILVFPLSQG
jgi:hypothetical protein